MRDPTRPAGRRPGRRRAARAATAPSRGPRPRRAGARRRRGWTGRRRTAPARRTPGRWPSSCASIGTSIGSEWAPAMAVDTRLPCAVRFHQHGHRAVAHLERGLADRGAGGGGVGRPRQPPGHLGDNGQVGRVLEREHARLLLGLAAVGDVAQRQHAPSRPAVVGHVPGRHLQVAAAPPGLGRRRSSSNGAGSPVRIRSVRAARSARRCQVEHGQLEGLVGGVAEGLREGRVDVDDLAVDVTPAAARTTRVPERAGTGVRTAEPIPASPAGGWRVAAVRGGREAFTAALIGARARLDLERYIPGVVEQRAGAIPSQLQRATTAARADGAQPCPPPGAGRASSSSSRAARSARSRRT